MNSYQKIKEVNKELRNDIFIMVTQPDSIDAIIIREKWKMAYGIEKAMFHGSPSDFEKVFSGLLPQLKQKG